MSDAPVIEVRPHDDVLLIAVLKARLDDVSTQQLVSDVLLAAGERHRVPIVLDMGAVKFAPSVALGSLVQLSKSFTLDNRRVALINIDRKIYGTIQVTQLDRVIEIHRTVEDVVKGKK